MTQTGFVNMLRRVRDNYTAVLERIYAKGRYSMNRQYPKIQFYSPTKLSTFKRCPLEYYSRYVERVAVVEGFDPILARANAAHTALAEAFNRYRIDGTFPISLDARVESLLPVDEYSERAAWLHDVEMVTEWIKGALSRFDGTSKVLGVEQTLDYRFRGSDEVPPFVLRARVDLVLEHPDGMIEHVDWKTGMSLWLDSIQNTATRIVTGQTYRGRPVQSTTTFLALGVKKSHVLERDAVRLVWQEIKDLVAAIESASTWPAVANSLCTSCSKYLNGCPIHSAEDDIDQMTLWLEDVA